MQELHRLLRLNRLPTTPETTKSIYLETAKKFQQFLAKELRGPLDLVVALNDESALLTQPKRERVFQLLSDELFRLRFVRMSSVMHPNARGAQRYAERIVDDVLKYQYEESHSSYEALVNSLAESIGAPLPTPEEALRAFGLDPNAPRGEIMQMIRPDIVTITIQGAKPPEDQTDASLMLPYISGASTVKAADLTVVHSPGDQTTILTGSCRYNLGYYKECWIKDSKWASGRHKVRLYVNGQRVLDTEVMTWSGKDLVLPYPAPIPGRPDPSPIDRDPVT